MHSLLVKEHLNTKCPEQLGKISLAETLSSVTNSSILENSQFGRTRVKNAVRMRAFPASGANLHLPPPIEIIRDTKTN